MVREGWMVSYDADTDTGYIGREDRSIPDVVLQFQHGPIQEAGGVNGIQNEELIQLLIMRIEALDLRMPSSFNKDALNGLDAAAAALMLRTKKRQEQGVEGTMRPHSDTEEIVKDA